MIEKLRDKYVFFDVDGTLSEYRYNDKLYGVGNGVSPMVFEIKLNGKNSKIKEIEYQANEKINPFLITQINEINNNEILYSGYATIDGKNSSALINCSTSKYECTISAKD